MPGRNGAGQTQSKSVKPPENQKQPVTRNSASFALLRGLMVAVQPSPTQSRSVKPPSSKRLSNQPQKIGLNLTRFE
jgi:hypothetical protein